MFDFRTVLRPTMFLSSHPFAGSRSLLLGVSATALLLGSLSGAQARSLGNGTSPAATAAAQAAASAQANAQQAAATASQAMIRAASSMQGMRNLQAAARAAAMAADGSVPNGLAAGGLVVAPGATPGKTDGGAGLWQGANLPTQSVAGGRTQVEIKQNEAKAILTWEKFNVGRETDLRFNQSAGGQDAANWIALNRVLDSSAAPSQILGTIKAEGQVYVINKNGIMFGGSSQINVHTLVASSLSLSNTQLMAGINSLLFQYDNNGLRLLLPTFGEVPSRIDPTTDPIVYGATPGNVIVQAGALIESQTGGKAMLFAPRVINAGTIRTPNGQTLMAAGENAWVFDPLAFNTGGKVRGLDVFASSPMRFLLNLIYFDGAFGGSEMKEIYTAVRAEMATRADSVGYGVFNSGVVEASRGNITMVGRDVAQTG
jgi:filamentous hemagglutinin